MASSFTSFWSLLKYHHSREVFLDQPKIAWFTLCSLALLYFSLWCLLLSDMLYIFLLVYCLSHSISPIPLPIHYNVTSMRGRAIYS